MRISVILARGLLSEARERGLETDSLLRESGLDGTQLQDLRRTLTMEEADRLIRRLVELTGDEGIGLSMGASAPDSMLQALGQLLFSQRTLRNAVEVLRHYAPLLSDGLSFALAEQAPETSLRVTSLIQMGRSSRSVMEYLLLVCKRLVQHFAPRGAVLREVRLSYPAPAYHERYVPALGCPARFEQSDNAIVFASDILDRVQLHGDAIVREHAGVLADRMLKERQHVPGVAEQVRTLLRFERDLHTVSLGYVAQRVGLSKRELRRKLTAERSPFVSLMAEARRRQACERIRRGDMTIKEIGAALGYSEPSAFHRAFKRWTGLTPTDYARQGEVEAPARSTWSELSP